MDYAWIKILHVTCVAISGAGFLLRGLLAWRGSALASARPLRVAPHVIDTLLLGSGIAMAVMARISPLAFPWLGAKIVALLVYIVLGLLALERGRSLGLSPAARAAAFGAALATFAYIVAVALRRSPAPWI
jgi:uncharacterized membrane protein SirB2